LKKERPASKKIVLMVAHSDNNDVDNLDEKILTQISRDMKDLKSKEIWTLKDKVLVVWVIFCLSFNNYIFLSLNLNGENHLGNH
jgi:hypothetical protein